MSGATAAETIRLLTADRHLISPMCPGSPLLAAGSWQTHSDSEFHCGIVQCIVTLDPV